MARILMRSSRRPRRARRKVRSLLFLPGSSSSLPGVGAVWTGDVTVLGGCGHVGLPLGLALADAGLKVALYDVNLAAVDRVGSGKMPHLEPGAPEVLARVLADGHADGLGEPSTVGACEHVIVVVGNPDRRAPQPRPPGRDRAPSRAVADQLHDGQLLILRSTVFPGVTRMVERLMRPPRQGRRRRLLPRAHRRGAGHGGAPAPFPRSCRPAPTGPSTGPRRCSAT